MSSEPPSSPLRTRISRGAAFWERTANYFRVHDSRAFGRLMLLYVALGVLVGGVAILFHIAVEAAEHFLLGGLAGFHPASPGGESPLFEPTHSEFRRWVLIVLPAAGALVSGLLVERFAPEAAGGGINALIRAYHEGAHIRRRVVWVKTVASALVLGSGGSAGREGPVAQVGLSVGALVARALRLDRRETLTLAAAGAAAGIGAIFHAPVASALLVAEILYREMELEHEVIVPALIASIVSYSIYTIKFAWSPLFVLHGYTFENPLELGPYLVLALVLGIQARWFTSFFQAVSNWFLQLKVPTGVKPAIGGLGVGLIGYLLPQSVGTGYGILQGALDGNIDLGILLGLALLKIVTTTLTVGSGGSGGDFGPSIVIGGALGGVVGGATVFLFPGLGANPSAFVVLGMVGFFSAVSNAPISTIILVTEMTGNYHMLVPAMWVCVIAYLLTRDISIFDAQRATRMDAPGHLTEALDGAARRYSVADAIQNREHEDPVSVHPDTSIGELRSLFGQSHHSVFPVVDDEGYLVGVVGDASLREAVVDGDLDGLVVAADLVEAAPTLRLDEPLRQAMDKLVTSHQDELVIVDAADERVVVGTLSRRDVVAFFDEGLQQAERDGAAGAPPTSVLEVLGSLVVDARAALVAGVAPGEAVPAESAPGDAVASDAAPRDLAPSDLAPGDLAPGDLATAPLHALPGRDEPR